MPLRSSSRPRLPCSATRRSVVPAVIAVAVLAFIAWAIWGPAPSLSYGLVAAVAVLIIACPCAMGLAVPVSIMVGTGRGAELGILFRRGDALQRLAGARVVAFDKTGTLTIGRPQLVAIETAGLAEDDALRIAAAAEARSSTMASRAAAASVPATASMARAPWAGAGMKTEGSKISVARSA